MIHGSDDEVVPSWMGEALFAQAANPRALLLVEGGRHGDLFYLAAGRIVGMIRRLAIDLTPAGPPQDVRIAS